MPQIFAAWRSRNQNQISPRRHPPRRAGWRHGGKQNQKQHQNRGHREKPESTGRKAQKDSSRFGTNLIVSNADGRRLKPIGPRINLINAKFEITEEEKRRKFAQKSK